MVFSTQYFYPQLVRAWLFNHTACKRGLMYFAISTLVKYVLVSEAEAKVECLLYSKSMLADVNRQRKTQKEAETGRQE
jgi:hypothetical protein